MGNVSQTGETLATTLRKKKKTKPCIDFSFSFFGQPRPWAQRREYFTSSHPQWSYLLHHRTIYNCAFLGDRRFSFAKNQLAQLKCFGGEVENPRPPPKQATALRHSENYGEHVGKHRFCHHFAFGCRDSDSGAAVGLHDVVCAICVHHIL